MSEPIFWSCDDTVEQLSHSEMDDAIEEHLDKFRPMHHEHGRDEAARTAAFVAALPEKITVYGYERMEVPANALDAQDVIDEFVQRPEDNEWAGQLKRLGEVVDVANYVPWGCEQTTEVEVVVLDWVKEHRPEWLVPW